VVQMVVVISAAWLNHMRVCQAISSANKAMFCKEEHRDFQRGHRTVPA